MIRSTYDGEKYHVLYRGKISQEFKVQRKTYKVAFCCQYYSFLIGFTITISLIHQLDLEQVFRDAAC